MPHQIVEVSPNIEKMLDLDGLVRPYTNVPPNRKHLPLVAFGPVCIQHHTQ